MGWEQKKKEKKKWTQGRPPEHLEVDEEEYEVPGRSQKRRINNIQKRTKKRHLRHSDTENQRKTTP